MILEQIALGLIKPVLGKAGKKVFDYFMSTPLDDVKARAENGNAEA